MRLIRGTSEIRQGFASYGVLQLAAQLGDVSVHSGAYNLWDAIGEQTLSAAER